MVTNFFKWLWALVVKLWVFIKTRLEVNDYYLVRNGNYEHILKRLSKGTENDFSDDRRWLCWKETTMPRLWRCLKTKQPVCR